MKKSPLSQKHNITNKFKDPEQSAFHFAAVENEMDFSQISDRKFGILFLSRDWARVYGTAKVSSIGSCIGSTIAFGVGMGFSLSLTSPLLISSLVGVVLSGFMVGRHSKGESFAKEETSFLEKHPSLISVLVNSAKDGFPVDVLAAIYEQLLLESASGVLIDATKIKAVFATHVNNMIETHQMGFDAKTAFQTGTPIALPSGYGEAFNPDDYDDDDYDDDDYDDDDYDDDETLDATIIPSVPEFIRKQEQEQKEAATTTAAVVPSLRSVDGVTTPFNPAKLTEMAQTVAAAPMPAAPLASSVKLSGDSVSPKSLLERLIQLDGFIPCRFFGGASRSGKSQLVSDAGALLRMRYPQATIIYISAGYKASEDERYWRFCNRSAAYSFKDISQQQHIAAYKEFHEILDTFRDTEYSTERPKILIVDEINTIISVGNNYGGIGKRVVSNLLTMIGMAANTGSKDGYILWAMAPVADMGSLGMNRGQSSVFNPVYVAKSGSSWNSSTYKSAVNNGLAPASLPIGFPENQRIVGIGNDWEVIPESPRLSEQIQDFRLPPIAHFADAFMESFTNPDSRIAQKNAVYEYLTRKSVPISKRTIQQARIPSIADMNSDEIGILLSEMVEEGLLMKNGPGDFYPKQMS
jgi:hypothetical protein